MFTQKHQFESAGVTLDLVERRERSERSDQHLLWMCHRLDLAA
jgi:hypothetical protein